MDVLITLLVLVGGVLCVSAIFRKSFALSVPVFLFAIILVLYLTGHVTSLRVGYYGLIAFALAGLCLTACQMIRKATRASAVARVFTPGLFVFAFLFFFIYVINIRRQFGMWDEFSSWGPMLMETIRTDGFHSRVGTALSAHRDYPPAIQLFQYMVCNLLGGFSEPNAYRSLQLLSLAVMLPVFQHVNRKHIGKACCLTVIMLLLPDALGNSVYQTIYIDTVLGILFGYGLYLVVTERKLTVFSCVNLFLLFFTLITAKPSGALWSMMILLALLIRFVLELKVSSSKTRERRETVRFFLVSALSGLAALAFGYFSWRASLGPAGTGGGMIPQSDNLSLRAFWEVITGGGLSYQHQALMNYRRAFFVTPVIPFFGLSFFSLILLFSAVGFALYARYKPTEYGNNLLALGIATPVVSLLYAVSMLVLYVFLLGSYEGPLLASYERYISTLFIGLGTGMFMSGSWIASKMEKESRGGPSFSLRKLGLACALLSVFVVPGYTYQEILHPRLFERTDNAMILRDRNRVFFETVDLEHDKVYLICQESNGQEYYVFKFFANPVQTNRGGWSIGTPVYEGDVWTRQMTADQWSKLLAEEEYDYVYLFRANEMFATEFGALFQDPSGIGDGKLYKVNRELGEVQLTEIP